ncbi:MAG TPA: bifunctional diaminohydroxyphosphoribosylaminopyrimidine deaminase/5-amino-6-(5-phosphoribosylamino)uracil reductase RibD [Puia sp.]|jgi:diaminohydroxyphosphoribosylaminopyrimidine deaminase/5-amino-6-(5-phosphoribosylamino)uracil reductase|nr:bifunctional diaminohydroxyphosphoribosylaminopyrimidine deaminase/5-amino-6-(5-phosphoribosylamino)uracil reductase RibD [Puia sp.]
MQRCLELARLGAGFTAPNPMVGAVLVYEGRIIGEGYHQLYGKAHAEVNCLAAVKEEDLPLIPQATLYVSLEPCAHYGKTPPCADLIIRHKIPRVVVGCRDPFPEVDGKGIEKLRAGGVEVKLGVLEKECISLNRRFFTYHTRCRPYILLKWAQSANLKIAAGDGDAAGRVGLAAGSGGADRDRAPGSSRVLISNEYSNRLVHRWRSEEAAILVGTNTALSDDPALTVRLWEGPQPIRLVVDKQLRLPATLKVFDRKVQTIVFNTVKQEEEENLLYYRLNKEDSLVTQIGKALYESRILSVLVEGGTRLLQSFIDEGIWDEARVITNNGLEIPDGLAAPVLKNALPPSAETLLTDTIRYYNNPLSLQEGKR